MIAMLAFGGSLWDVITADATYASTMRFATLLAFAAIGEWIAERAGTMNISLEAMILTAAFTSALGSDITGNVWMALLVPPAIAAVQRRRRGTEGVS